MVCAVQNRSFVVDIQCNMCRKFYTIILNRQDILEWSSGVGPIEEILDYLSADDRELLISQTCGSCFDSLFSPLDNDD